MYLTSLNEKLRAAGLAGGLAFFQGLGGGISLDKARAYPLGLLGSGPAGGAIGANELAKRMGKKRVLLGDMGGTSFDTGIIVDNEIHIEKNLELGPFHDRRQPRRRDLGRRRRRLDRLGLRARRAAGRPAESPARRPARRRWTAAATSRR